MNLLFKMLEEGKAFGDAACLPLPNPQSGDVYLINGVNLTQGINIDQSAVLKHNGTHFRQKFNAKVFFHFSAFLFFFFFPEIDLYFHFRLPTTSWRMVPGHESFYREIMGLLLFTTGRAHSPSLNHIRIPNTQRGHTSNKLEQKKISFLMLLPELPSELGLMRFE